MSATVTGSEQGTRPEPKGYGSAAYGVDWACLIVLQLVLLLTPMMTLLMTSELDIDWSANTTALGFTVAVFVMNGLGLLAWWRIRRRHTRLAQAVAELRSDRETSSGR